VGGRISPLEVLSLILAICVPRLWETALREAPVPGSASSLKYVQGAALVGVEGVAVEVEVLISSLLPKVDIVGLPEAAVRESAARVRAAISALGLTFPTRRVTVNLAPAGLRKSGAGLDLPIAVGVLAADEKVPFEALRGRAFLAELALDGRLRPVRGALAMALAARDAGCEEIVVCERNGPEAALAPGIRAVGAGSLAAVLAHLHGGEQLAEARPPERGSSDPAPPCLSEVRGQEVAKRALEIAAGGGHGLLLFGPPGSGKTMLARRLPGLLPPLNVEESLDVARILSAAGRLDGDRPLLCERPFRAPHHTASPAGLLGGGNPPRPGEISLAHRGILFMDEFPEFERRALESLRQILEERRVSIARAGVSCVFPADFQLVAASNPCPCGWFRSQRRDCRCDDATVARYRRRISGPLLDRIDLQVFVSAVPWRDLESPADGPTSSVVRERVRFARARQERRGVACNAEIHDRDLDHHAALDTRSKELLGRAVDRLGLSARGARRVLRVARTIADLAAEERISPSAIAEALSYRRESIDS